MNASSVFEFYDALSRRRALTDNESIMLEKAIVTMDSAPKPRPKRSGHFVFRQGDPEQVGWTPAQIDGFFEGIANGHTIAESARSIGKTERAGAGFFHRYRLSLGAQGQ